MRRQRPAPEWSRCSSASPRSSQLRSSVPRPEYSPDAPFRIQPLWPNAMATMKTPHIAVLVLVVCIGLVLAGRRAPTVAATDPAQGGGFTRVGREGPVFTVSVPRSRASDDEYLMKVAERLSSEEARTGGSGQVSVMIWPD